MLMLMRKWEQHNINKWVRSSAYAYAYVAGVLTCLCLFYAYACAYAYALERTGPLSCFVFYSRWEFQKVWKLYSKVIS